MDHHEQRTVARPLLQDHVPLVVVHLGRIGRRLERYGVGWKDRTSIGKIWRRLERYGVGWKNRASVGKIWRRLEGLGVGTCKATWEREFKLPWREAGPSHHHDDKVDSDQ